MKTLITAAIIATLAIIFSFTTTTDHRLAKVKTTKPLMFYNCEPVAEFEILGNVKVGTTVWGAAAENRNSILKRCNKDFPNADGLIFSDDQETASAIKFKE